LKVLGIDFTSAPGRIKPIACVEAVLQGRVLRVGEVAEWRSFDAFEAALRMPGPWIAGIDFPFGQSRRFIENIGWPRRWEAYVQHARNLGRDQFRRVLDAYRVARPPGDKEHQRASDRLAGAISPQKLYRVPVGWMFFAGAPRLLDADVTIARLRCADPQRIVVEAYPGLLARRLIGRDSYKADSRREQTSARHAARIRLLDRLVAADALSDYGVELDLPPPIARALADDPAGDRLDALLCAILAAWAWTQRDHGFGAPSDLDRLEGWIADPFLRDPSGSPPHVFGAEDDATAASTVHR
jgi:hypothetical protein